MRAWRVVFVIGLTLLTVFFSFRGQSYAAEDLNQKIAVLSEKLAFANEGQVMNVSDDILYLDLGQQDGILQGNMFEIVRLGEPIRAGNEILGYEEQIIGKAEAYRVRKKLTLARVVEKSEIPRAGDKAYQIKKNIKRLVVAQFSYNQGFNQFTKNLQEKLFTDLVQKGMQVVERDQLERVLKEQKLGYSGLINLNSAKKVGELLGAEGMVLGTISDLGNSVSVNARLVDLENGNSLAAAEVDLPKTPLIAALLSETVEEDNSFAVAPKTKGKTTKNIRKSLFFENDRFRIEVISFKREPEGLVLKLRYLNRTKGPVRVWLSGPEKNAYLVDDAGNQYTYKDAELRKPRDFPPGVPRISAIMFREMKGGGTEFIFSAKYTGRGGDFFANIKGMKLQ
jgi:TolB-like protein